MSKIVVAKQSLGNIPFSISTEVFDKVDFQRILSRYSKSGNSLKEQLLKSELTDTVSFFLIIRMIGILNYKKQRHNCSSWDSRQLIPQP